MKLICIQLLLFLFPAVMLSQNKVSGVVTDKAMQPIESVKVSIVGSNREALTNEMGEYIIQKPKGRISLEFSKNGYVTQSVDVRSAVVNITMISDADFSDFKFSLNDLLNIKIKTASIEKQSLTNTPAVVSVYTSQDIYDYQFSSMADIIQTAPGVDVLNDLTYYNAGIRGINGGLGAQSSVIKPIIDGQNVSFRSTTGSLLGPEFFPLIAIDRVELVRGPLSALYGENAFLGVLNVVPHSAESLTANYGAVNLWSKGGYQNSWGNSGYSAQLAAWKNSNKVDFVAATTYQYSDRSALKLPYTSPDFDRYPITETAKDISRSFSGYTKVIYNDTSIGKLSFDALTQVFDNNANFTYESSPLQGSRIGMYNVVSRLNYEKQLSDCVNGDASFSYATGGPASSEKLYDIYQAAEYIKRSFSYSAIDMKVELSYTHKNSFIGVGVDYSRDRETLPSIIHVTNHKEFFELAGMQENFQNAGIFIQYSQKLKHKINSVLGLRYDKHSIYGNQLNYRAGLVYAFSNTSSLKALIGRSFKSPSAFQLYGNPAYVFGPTSNPELKSQNATTSELYYGALFKEFLNIGINVYYTRVNDFAETIVFGDKIEQGNTATIDALGGELDVRFYFPANRLTGFGNLSIVNTNLSSTWFWGPKISQAGLFPSVLGRLGFTYHVKHFHFSALSLYTGERRADITNINRIAGRAEYFLPAYHLLNLGVSYNGIHLIRPLKTELSVSMKNVFNKDYIIPGNIGIDVPGLGRNVSFSIAQTF